MLFTSNAIVLARLFLLLFVLAASGCGSGYSSQAHRVESKTARETMLAVLESWKAGENPEAWQQKDPSVVIQDFDWMGGAELATYEILSEKAIDANLHCEVRLQLQAADDRRSEKTVTYLVSTSPVLTVFRAAQP